MLNTLDEPIQSFVDLDIVLAHLDRAFDQRITERFVVEHLRPFIEREKVRAAERGDRIGDWISRNARGTTEHRDETGYRPRLLTFGRTRCIGQTHAEIHCERNLDRFITTSPGSSGGGLVGSVGRSALGFASRAGKGLLGQIGGQFEQQLQSAVSFAANRPP